MAGKVRRVYGRKFWEELVARFEEAPQQTRRVFAAENRVNYHTFCEWLRRIRQEAAEGGALAPVRFVEVKRVEEERGHPSKVVLDLGVARMHFDELCDPRWLAEVVSQLQRVGERC